MMTPDNKKKILFLSILGGLVLILIIVLIITLVGSGDKTPVESGSMASGLQGQSNIDAESNESLDSGESLNTESIDLSNSSSTTSITGQSSQMNSAVTSSGTSSLSASVSIPVQNSEQTSNSSTSGGNDMPKVINTKIYNLFTASRPFWSGNTVYNESVYPMTTQGGQNEVVQLLYAADKILEVRSSDLKTLYKEGKDYTLQGGKIVIPTGSSINVNKYNEYYLTQEVAEHSQMRTGGGFIYFSEGATFHNRQIAVTYTHKDAWGGTTPTKRGTRLPHLKEAIRKKDAVTVVYYGDSISAGASASSTFGSLPNGPKWTEMFSEYMESLGVSVTQYNTSVGGQISSWGADNVVARVNRYAPDLVVLGFGMNDSNAFNQNSPSVYKANTKRTIEKIRATHPDAEIILIGTMLPNPEAKQFVGEQVEFTKKLFELESEFTGVAVADITSVHQYIMTRKNYRDMTGNNVNHPNDYLSRVYLQVLIETIS